MLLSDSGSLDPSAVKGIASLVASSVQGLSDQKVTITDSSGALLWPTSAPAPPTAPPPSRRPTTSTTRQTAAAATALLAQTLGPGKAQVVVNADVNANQATSDTLTYGKKGVPLTQQTQTETLKGGGGTAGGTTGTIPAYAATAAARNSNYQNKTSNTTFGVDKTVTHSVIAPGAVNNQTVSVLVDKSVPASSIPAIKNAVAGAVGLNAKRGDTPVGLPDRLRQAGRHDGQPHLPDQDARLRQVRGDRRRRAALPVLHAAQPQAARARGVRRPAHLAARARDPAAAGRARLGRRR